MIAVITPYFKESAEALRRCHESVMNQKVDSKHILIADGYPQRIIDDWDASHITLPAAHADYGNTPRGIGGLLAASEGYEFIAYLDADNWFHPGHLQSLLSLHQTTRATVCCAFRTFHDHDGKELSGVKESDEMSLQHIDTSCYLIHRRAFRTLDVWLNMPKQLSIVGDRIFRMALHRERHTFAFTKQHTVAYTTLWKAHFAAANLPMPTGAKESVSNEWQKWLLSIDGVRESVDRLGFYPL